MNDSAPAWDSDPQNDADVPQAPNPNFKPVPLATNETKSILKPIHHPDADDHQHHSKVPNGKKEIQKDQGHDEGELWEPQNAGKKEQEKKQNRAQASQEKKNQLANSKQEEKDKSSDENSEKKEPQKISYDKFVNDLHGDGNSKKEQGENLNVSNWDASMNADENPQAFKKKKVGNQTNGPSATEQPRGFTRGDGGFKRSFGENNQDNRNSNGENFGFSGGRGRSFGDRQGRQGGFGGGGGRGFNNQQRQGGRGFGDSGGRGGGGFGGDRGGGFGGGRGGYGGDRGDRGGIGGDRGFGGGDRGFGGGRGGGRGRGGRGGFGGGFGRRDFGDGDGGGNYGGRREFNGSEPDRGFQNIVAEIEPEKQTFNIAQLSMIEGIPKVTQKSKMSPQFRINTTMATEPLGLKCWPTVSIYVKRSKLSLYLSRIHDHNCSILYFPYSNYCMNLYPGNMVNQFPFDYRKKLKEKNKPVGQAYLQRCVGIKNFQVIAFAMISQDDQTSTAKSIQSLFEQANRAEKQVLESAILPYSLPLGSLKPIVKVCFDALDKYDKFKEIIISTNDPKTFCKAANQFLEVIQELADNNDLVIQ